MVALVTFVLSTNPLTYCIMIGYDKCGQADRRIVGETKHPDSVHIQF